MRILALDTSGTACSVALAIDGTVSERHEPTPQRHAERLLPLVVELLEAAGIGLPALDAIAVGIGPGAFTGVRVATAVAQGLALAHALPVVPVSSLAALAQDAWRRTGRSPILALRDARRAEIYWGWFAGSSTGVVQARGPEHVGPPAAIEAPDEPWIAIGSGWRAHHGSLVPRFGDRDVTEANGAEPRARDVALLATQAVLAGRTITAAQLEPVYLRNAV